LFKKQKEEYDKQFNKANIFLMKMATLTEEMKNIGLNNINEKHEENLKRIVDLSLEIEEIKNSHKDLNNPIIGFEKHQLVPSVQSFSVFCECQEKLDNMLGGKIEYDYETNRWYFKQGNQKFSVGVMAEGIKKIAILDTLLSNGYLSENSIVFIDEPESALHPQAISQLLDIIAALANHGIQFFLASHSYFVIKKLFLIAQEQQMSIPVLSYQNDEWVQSDLKDDLPDNPIIDESIKLYEQQLDMD
jgi:predicted ATPase